MPPASTASPVAAGLTRLLLAALVLAGACGDGDDDSDGWRGSFNSTASTSSTTSTAGAAAGAAAGASTSTTAAGRSPATTSTSTSTVRAGGAAAPAATSTAASAGSSSAALTFTPPGTYRYATTGRFTSSLGPPQSRDGETVLTVDPPAGADQHSLRQGLGRTTEQVLRLDAGSAHLVSLRQSEQGITKEFRPSPPALVLPAGAAPGRSWSWRATSTDGQTTVDARFRVARTEEVSVGAQRVNTLVLEVVLTLTGDVVSTTKQTLWVSPGHGLVLRQDEATEGRLGAVTFSSTSSDTLVSLTPG